LGQIYRYLPILKIQTIDVDGVYMTCKFDAYMPNATILGCIAAVMTAAKTALLQN